MTTTKPEDLRKAYKKEKDPHVVKRMAAVNMVCVHGDSIQDTADSLMQCPNRVSCRARRFEEGAALAPFGTSLEAAGPPKAGAKKTAKAGAGAGSTITPRAQARHTGKTRHQVPHHQRQEDNARDGPDCQDGPPHPRQQNRYRQDKEVVAQQRRILCLERDMYWCDDQGGSKPFEKFQAGDYTCSLLVVTKKLKFQHTVLRLIGKNN